MSAHRSAWMRAAKSFHVPLSHHAKSRTRDRTGHEMTGRHTTDHGMTMNPRTTGKSLPAACWGSSRGRSVEEHYTAAIPRRIAQILHWVWNSCQDTRRSARIDWKRSHGRNSSWAAEIVQWAEGHCGSGSDEKLNFRGCCAPAHSAESRVQARLAESNCFQPEGCPRADAVPSATKPAPRCWARAWQRVVWGRCACSRS